MPVFSTRLATGTLTVAAGKSLAFTVPAGYRAVIRYLSYRATYAAGVGLLIYLNSGGPFLARVDSPANTAYVNLELRLTYHEGESCYLQTLVNQSDYSLHGFMLQGSGGPLIPGSLPA